MRVKVTNIARGPRGIQTARQGTVMIEPGESAVIELDRERDEGNVRAAQKAGWFEFAPVREDDEDDDDQPAFRDSLDHDGDGHKGGSTADEPPALTGKNKAQLLEIAAAEGVTVADGATNAQIIEAIEAKRAGGVAY